MGRFIVDLKVVGEEVIPVESDLKPLERDEIFHELPTPDPFFDFSWRVRVDLRSHNKVKLSPPLKIYKYLMWVAENHLNKIKKNPKKILKILNNTKQFIKKNSKNC